MVDDFESPGLSKEIKSELVVCCDVIEHLVNPDLLLTYIKDRMDVNGIAVISTPERDRLRGKGSNSSPNKYHIREWNFKEFAQYLENRDFEIINHFVQFPLKFGLNQFF